MIPTSITLLLKGVHPYITLLSFDGTFNRHLVNILLIKFITAH